MKYSQNVLNVLAALSFKGIGRAFIVKNYKARVDKTFLDTLKKASKENLNDKEFEAEFETRKEQIKNKLEDLEGFADGFVAFGDENFPLKKAEFSDNLSVFEQKEDDKRSVEKIKEADFPVFLSYKGDLKLLSKKNMNIAIIGLLNPSEKVIKAEQIIAEEFAKENAVIVSGLALGCDSIAHKSALKCHAASIAILPSTLKNIIPKENKELAQELAIDGLLISEYYEEAAGLKEQISRFVERDRLQALFSDMVILSASYTEADSQRDKKLDSGSRHAMAKAKEYGIRRAVIYDESFADDEQFNLNRELIEQIAPNLAINAYPYYKASSWNEKDEPEGIIECREVKIDKERLSKGIIINNQLIREINYKEELRLFKILNESNIKIMVSAYKKFFFKHQ